MACSAFPSCMQEANAHFFRAFYYWLDCGSAAQGLQASSPCCLVPCLHLLPGVLFTKILFTLKLWGLNSDLRGAFLYFTPILNSTGESLQSIRETLSWEGLGNVNEREMQTHKIEGHSLSIVLGISSGKNNFLRLFTVFFFRFRKTQLSGIVGQPN